ncbi:hypothetical protein SAMN02745975_00527 [Geosporobacter subterraneus DSM 17957]|uniref:Prophage pi2 protein 40 n=1 Tax=Geosporobacter subterraneus DSM 17957 TaxID=1121919 RepID=A0A1M6DPC0_9FIRM|nr:hypothetical protein [Geosporobacter subterraneus]SHI75087.1 hypothetical protein SAMN02745975_00527 [Geosporobacter subterraneus DSM 17957]
MERILTIDGRQVKFKSTGAFLLKYKVQFNRDAIKDIFRLAAAIDKENNTLTDIDAFDLELFYNLVWVLAKTADPQLPPPVEWLDSFSEFPLMDIIPEISDMIFSCLTSTAPFKKK